MSRGGRIIVTGSSGFIGSHLVDALLDAGHAVVGIDVKPPHRSDYEWREHDIRHALGTIDSAHTWFHLAALTSPWQSMDCPHEFELTNAVGTERVANAAVLSGAKSFVFISTSALYGEVAGDRLAAESDSVPRDVTPYAATKYRGELHISRRAEANGWTGGNLRLGNIYGPRQDPKTEAGVVAIFATALLARKGNRKVTVYGDGGIRDFVYVGDCIDAIMRAAESDQWLREVNIGTGRGTSVWELLRQLETITERAAVAERAAHRAGETGRTVLDPSYAHRCLDWEATTPFDEGLERTLDSFREARKPK